MDDQIPMDIVMEDAEILQLARNIKSLPEMENEIGLVLQQNPQMTALMYENWKQKLKGFRYISSLEELKVGKLFRFIQVRHPTKLDNPHVLIRVENGSLLLRMMAQNKPYFQQLLFTDLLLFQKLSPEELMVLEFIK